ncbi:hypothetical protein MA16_Dca005443 [Dendrobium catenatum]|uniref:Uncharacterized protein n=1 Tax=Dendrobium catenatum TaxID=906689 RepID=A0A2I0X3E5_9ASPA|nr:hypothetical protein MA16_Dca005443 [Dendrobium catenatum]
MASPGNPNWLLECPLIEDFTVPPENEFIWTPQGFNDALSNGRIAHIETHAYREERISGLTVTREPAQEGPAGPGSARVYTRRRRKLPEEAADRVDPIWG